MAPTGSTCLYISIPSYWVTWRESSAAVSPDPLDPSSTSHFSLCLYALTWAILLCCVWMWKASYMWLSVVRSLAFTWGVGPWGLGVGVLLWEWTRGISWVELRGGWACETGWRIRTSLTTIVVVVKLGSGRSGREETAGHRASGWGSRVQGGAHWWNTGHFSLCPPSQATGGDEGREHIGW